MECTECGNDIVLVKKDKVLYDGIRVDNIYLENCEVEFCRHCGTESPVVRNIKKVHAMIALGMALQPAKLTGNEVRFLRKAVRMNAAEWAARIGIAAETFSRWENGRSPANQVEKLARIDFLMSISKEISADFVDDGIVEVLAAEFADKRDFAIVVDLDDLDARPEYANLEAQEFDRPSRSQVEASTFASPLAVASLIGKVETDVAEEAAIFYAGENQDDCNTFALAA